MIHNVNKKLRSFLSSRAGLGGRRRHVQAILVILLIEIGVVCLIASILMLGDSNWKW